MNEKDTYMLQCSATCGDGLRKRDVVCIKKLGDRLFTVVNHENCQSAEKPQASESCGPLPECEPQWFMTEWAQVRFVSFIVMDTNAAENYQAKI